MATDYGSDIALGVRSAPNNWSLASGPENVMNAIARRYRTTRRTLFYDLEYGYNLTDLIGEDISAAKLAIMANEIAEEAEKDERVLNATAVVASETSGALSITVSGELREGEVFALVLSVSALNVEVLNSEIS